jgi:hypothetical protein
MRISATWIEQYRRVIETDYASEDELAAQIQGKPFEPSWQMKCGSAFHHALETFRGPVIEGDESQRVAVGDYLFSVPSVVAAQRFIGPGLWEVKHTMEIEGATVVAKVDHVCGLFLQDNKCKFSTADCKDYEPSLQWRLYLLIHGAECLRYNLWSFKDPDETGYCELRDMLSFRFWRYTELESDCRRWVKMFLSWVESKGLSRAA